MAPPKRLASRPPSPDNRGGSGKQRRISRPNQPPEADGNDSSGINYWQDWNRLSGELEDIQYGLYFPGLNQPSEEVGQYQADDDLPHLDVFNFWESNQPSRGPLGYGQSQADVPDSNQQLGEYGYAEAGVNLSNQSAFNVSGSNQPCGGPLDDGRFGADFLNPAAFNVPVSNQLPFRGVQAYGQSGVNFSDPAGSNLPVFTEPIGRFGHGQSGADPSG